MHLHFWHRESVLNICDSAAGAWTWKLCRLSCAECQSKVRSPTVHPAFLHDLLGKAFTITFTNSSLVLDVDICLFTSYLRSVWMHRHMMTYAALGHCRLWIGTVFIYVFQQGQNNVWLSKSEVAQYITLHRYEWKQDVHTDLWWWNGFGLLWKNSVSVLFPLRKMFKTVAFPMHKYFVLAEFVYNDQFFQIFCILERRFFFGSINFSCFCSSFHCQF